jgi:hypothetical protein
MSADLAISKIDDLLAAYAELEGTAIPQTLDAAVADRFEIAVSVAELAAFTSYPAAEQLADSRRAVSLRAVFRAIRDLEEEIILQQVLKPTALAERAFWSNTLGWRKKIYDAIVEFVSGLQEILRRPQTAWDALWLTLSNVLLLRFAATLDSIALPEIAKLFFRGMKMRDKATLKLRQSMLPQRGVKRHRVRRKTRRL